MSLLMTKSRRKCKTKAMRRNSEMHTGDFGMTILGMARYKYKYEMV